MIIVSQSGEEIINFEQVSVITFDEMDNGIWKIKAFYISGRNTPLGKYKTKERAKEVLQEIIEVLKNEEFFHIKKSSLNNLDELAEPKYILKPVSRPKVYEMPKE